MEKELRLLLGLDPVKPIKEHGKRKRKDFFSMIKPNSVTKSKKGGREPLNSP